MKKDIFNALAVVITDLYELKDEESGETTLFNKTRKTHITEPRQVLIYLCSDYKMKNVTIIKYLNEKGLNFQSSDIVRSKTALEGKIEEDRDYERLFDRLRQKVNHIINNQ
tara:strand:- start:7687 stop:8019 length:333 start_codon:yes stop_codon:yes gene_type:complete